MTIYRIIVETFGQHPAGWRYLKATSAAMPGLIGSGSTPLEAVGDLMFKCANAGHLIIEIPAQVSSQPADNEV
jgi:hypothetical protein